MASERVRKIQYFQELLGDQVRVFDNLKHDGDFDDEDLHLFSMCISNTRQSLLGEKQDLESIVADYREYVPRKAKKDDKLLEARVIDASTYTAYKEKQKKREKLLADLQKMQEAVTQ